MVIHKKKFKHINNTKNVKYAKMGWEIAQIIQKRKKSLLWQLLVQKQKYRKVTIFKIHLHATY